MRFQGRRARGVPERSAGVAPVSAVGGRGRLPAFLGDKAIMHPTLATARTIRDLARPFTLLAPALGMASGAVTAMGAQRFGTPIHVEPWMLRNVVLGALMAALLNAASNVLNQIYDLDIDRINKPSRPLVSGRASKGLAWRVSLACYGLALGLAYVVSPPGTRCACLILATAAAAATVAYSVPPLRWKRLGLGANLVIAVPRGMLLKVAGWAVIRPVTTFEPWFIGGVFFLFLLGATTTKDYADIAGDAAGGCRTLPIRCGVRRSALLISPSFVLPFLLIPVGAWSGVLTGNRMALCVLGGVLAAWGGYVVYLILRDPQALASTENHPSWRHMYAMMFLAQIGFAVAYCL